MDPSRFTLIVRIIVFAGLVWQTSHAVHADPATPAVDPEAKILIDHLRQLESVVEDRLRPQSRLTADEAELARLTERFLTHLRLLEPRLGVLDPERAEAVRRQLRRLRNEVESLEVIRPSAADQPAELGPPRKAEPAARMPAAPSDRAVPVNDDCDAALPLGNGAHSGDTSQATRDGTSSCAPRAGRDVWFRYTPSASGLVNARLTEDSAGEQLIAVHAVCPGTPFTEIACGGRALNFEVTAGSEILIRVFAAEFDPGGPFTLVVGPASSLSGTVSDATTGEPLPAIVAVYDSDDRHVRSVATGDGGDYTVVLPHPGTYFAETRGTDLHRDESYDDIVCMDDYCDPSSATPIVVAPGAAVSGIDFALDRLGSISGTVIDAATGEPLASVTVYIWTELGFTGTATSTDDSGNYLIEGIPPGTYFVVAVDSGYLNELFDDIPCADPFFGGDCDPTTGAPIAIELGSTVTGIDFELVPLGGIAGRVTDAATGEPLPFVDVRVLTADGYGVGVATTETDGRYLIRGLDPGSYFVRTSNLADYVDEVYSDLPCPPRIGCDLTAGDAVTVAVDAVTEGIDIALDLGGRVTGSVVEAATGAPLAEYAGVAIRTADNNVVASATFDEFGNYAAGGLATGTYYATASQYGWITELYDDVPCPGENYSCDVPTGDSFEVEVRGVTPDIDFVLDRLGAIAGTVTDQATGDPVSGFLWIWRADGRVVETEVVSETGEYLVEGLPPGTYFVRVESDTHYDEIYDDVPCTETDCDPLAGTLVEITVNTTTSGIDFALAPRPLGSISGTVRGGPDGAPLWSYRVSIWDENGSIADSSITDSSGFYETIGLAPGAYRVATNGFFITRDDFRYIDQIYDGFECPGGNCDPADGTPISVVEETTTPGIDFALTRLGTISGTVRDSLTGNPLPSVRVVLRDASGSALGSASTGHGGTYAMKGLAAGDYFLSTRNNDGFIDQLHDGLPCLEGLCDPTAGTLVRVDLGAVLRVDFELDLFQGITGRVTHEPSGIPLAADVDIWSPDSPNPVATVETGDSGEYVVGLPLGTYFVSTDTRRFLSDLEDEIYEGLTCPDGRSPGEHGCDPTQGQPVEMTGGTVIQGVDFTLSGTLCLPASWRLCLDGGRFAVEADWQDFEGGGDFARAEPLTDDTGYFWFFAPENVEVLVKVLDACVEPFDRFWIFAAGLTDLATEITVRDTWSGEERTYANPLGTAFELVRDTSSFATCAVGEESIAAVELARHEVDATLDQLAAGTVPGPGLAAAGLLRPEKSGACVPTATHLCLGEGRFQVETAWRTASAETGIGQAVPLTDDTGYFWFFGGDNVEAVVKVLDACNLDPFNNFWVFAAGLTDVEVTLRVTDTESGVVREYVNPLGRPFRPIQDLDAFSTCP